jgi:hypothetical protein
MAAEYRDKRKLIATVRGQYLSFATFPTFLLSHYPLPLMHFFSPGWAWLGFPGLGGLC